MIGVPVGFVGAMESKEALLEHPLAPPHLVVRGRRGGSAIACGAVNALASEADAAQVIAAAARAARGWGTTSLARRTQVMFAFRELLNSRKDELAAIITAEHGKVHSDAIGEISRGLEVVEFACGISHLLKGGHSE